MITAIGDGAWSVIDELRSWNWGIINMVIVLALFWFMVIYSVRALLMHFF